MNADADTLSLVLPSEFSVLDQLVTETEAFLSSRLDDDDLSYRIVLLATEAVTNAIEHGNGLDARKQVYMVLRVGAERIDLTVEDEGAGFDPSSVENPLDEENLLQDGGRGVYLIEQMADEVAFEAEGRRVRMSFKRPA